ncbi:MAG: hypothetical protein EPN93_05380 [Spirochaetes bacterium]|nr:MAG: hypothetical protein EPN93_05380 [Spirochaetota bacterium]
MTRKILAVVAACVFMLGIGCTTSYDKMIKKSEESFYFGKYKDAAKSLLPEVNKEGKDQLLFMMECGLMLHAAGDYPNSNKVLLAASALSERIAKSISKEALSLFLNDTVTNYRGEDFEVVLVHMYLGINFLMLKDADSARVEFKKVNDLLAEIQVLSGRAYKQNLMAKYLTAIAFELIGDKDNDKNDQEFAYIEYKQIVQLDPRLALVYRDLQRMAKKIDYMDDYAQYQAQYGKQDEMPEDAGELIMIYESGQGAIKASRGSLLSDKAMADGIRISLNGLTLQQGVTAAAVLASLKLAENPIPKFQKRSNKVSFLMINVDGKDIARTYMLENIEDTALKNMEDDYTKMYFKVAAGVVTKAVAAIVAGLVAKKAAEQLKKTSGVAGLIGTVVGAGVGAGLMANIKPDLRCWHTLPANLQLGRLFLKEGKYTIKIRFLDDAGNEVIGAKEGDIEIKKGAKTFFNYRTLF